MIHLLQQQSRPKNKAQSITAFCELVIASALFMPASTRAATLEVQGILADVQMRIQAPEGCGQVRSWHGQMQDMDGVMRNSVHRGLDIVAPAGTPIRAAAPGKVIYQEKQWAGGNSLLIWHGKDHFSNHIISYYGHLQEFKTALGKTIERGEIIGRLGASGNNMPKSGTPHLHFEVLIYPEDEPAFRFGWLRNFTTVSPNFFIIHCPKTQADRQALIFYVGRAATTMATIPVSLRVLPFHLSARPAERIHEATQP
jgi:murein DD-endopeptidase MepM/ murein hydrolase activator NlpD